MPLYLQPRGLRTIFGAVMAVLLTSSATSTAQTPSIPEIRAKAEAGDSTAMAQLGKCYQDGTSVARDDEEALKWLRKAAEAGNVDGMRFLGHCCKHLSMTPKNGAEYAKEAEKWYRKAAETGDVEAMSALGYFYGGPLIREDQYNFKEAVKWHKKAAEMGKVFSMNALGHLYCDLRFGSNEHQDYAEAAKWYSKAADGGDPDSMVALGDIYSEGKGGGQNYGEAVKWYRKAADTYWGAYASFAIGVFYYKGKGVPQNYSEAAFWFRKAAQNDDGNGMLELGKLYEYGQGVPKNLIMAYALYNYIEAKEISVCDYKSDIFKPENINASFYKDRIIAKLNPAQLAEGQLLATKWFENGLPQLEDRTSDNNRIPDGNAVPSSSGTGFFVTTDGYFLTAAHVVAKAKSITVSIKDTTFPARVIRIDERNDVALLKAEGQFTALPFAPSRSVKLGADVFTIGFPNIVLQGATPKLCKGAVNALAGIVDDPSCFQISVAIQPGNSGGPLINTDGNVVGLITSKLNDIVAAKVTGSLPQNVNYAVKSAYVMPLLELIPESSALPSATNGQTFDVVAAQAEKAVFIVLSYE